jgi:hypothetical protein
MSIQQTVITTVALVWAVATYMMQMYGAYTAQQANLSDSTGQAGREVDAGFVVGGTIMNILLTLYLLYYIYAIRYDKHGDVFKIIGTFVLILGIALDIFFSVFAVQLTPATTKGEVWQSYDFMYAVTTLNFFVRLFLIVQFQCSDVLARRLKIAPAPVVENIKKQILPGNTGPRPERGPNPFVKSEEGGRRRRR